MKRRIVLIILRVLSYVLVAAVACGIGVKVSGGKLGQLERVISRYYVDSDQVDMDQLEDVAAAAMVDSLPDGWSYYISAEEYEAFENNRANEFVGVGITISVREDQSGFDIVAVNKGVGAEKAGIQIGDILIAIDGQSMEGKVPNDAGLLIRGDEGTCVKLTVLRGEEKKEFTVERMRILVEVVSYTMLEEQIGYVRIENFHERSADEAIAAVKALQNQGAKALIFDVRYNPGGYVDELVKLLDYLLPEGEVFRSVNYQGKTQVKTSDADCVKLPMAVLMNKESYSAAEFFPAVLEEYDWAITVGEHTVGKGHFQETIRLSDGSAVNLSTGKYYTPKGVSLSEVGGLEPNIPVSLTEEEAAKLYSGILPYEEDPQLQAAIAELKK